MAKQIHDAQQRRQVLAVMGQGCEVHVAADCAGVTEEDVYETIYHDRHFMLRFRKARHRAEVSMLNYIHEAAKDPKNWRAAAWLLERINPDRFGLRRANTVTNKQFQQVLNNLVGNIVDAVDDPKICVKLLECTQQTLEPGDTK